MVVYAADGLERRSQAYDLLSIAAEEHWGLTCLPPLVRSPLGKPAFSPILGREFNLSHSGSLALCVLDSTPVGADIQIVKSWRPSLPRRVCSPEEFGWLEQQPDFWNAFTALWAMKESRAKQSGQGLRGSIAAISVPLPRPGETLYAHQGLWFRLWSGRDWAGAVCGTTPPPDEIRWRSLAPDSSAPPSGNCKQERDENRHDL